MLPPRTRHRAAVLPPASFGRGAPEARSERIVAMSSLMRGTCVGLLLAVLAQQGLAQEIPKTEYIDYEPLTPPRIVGQTRASEAFHLFGDQRLTAPGTTGLTHS
jgi:hypothetical protein